MNSENYFAVPSELEVGNHDEYNFENLMLGFDVSEDIRGEGEREAVSD